MDQSVGIDTTDDNARGTYSKGLAARERILESAIRLLARKGYGGCSISDIATDSGCTKNQLFHHFGSKEGIAVMAVRAAGTAWWVDVGTPLAEQADPLARLDRIVAIVRSLEAEDWGAVRLLALLALTADSLPGELKSETQSVMQDIAQFINTLSQDACNAQRELSVPPAAIAAYVRCLVFGWGSSGNLPSDSNVITPAVLIGTSQAVY